jgi:hypothetical protein
MASPSSGLGAIMSARFKNSPAGKEYYGDSAMDRPIHKFTGGAHGYGDAISAVKRGYKLDMGSADKYQRSELNRQFLQSLRPKQPVENKRDISQWMRDISMRGSHTNLLYDGINTSITNTSHTGGVQYDPTKSVYSVTPNMR